MYYIFATFYSMYYLQQTKFCMELLLSCGLTPLDKLRAIKEVYGIEFNCLQHTALIGPSDYKTLIVFSYAILDRTTFVTRYYMPINSKT